ncbi:MAG TPA: co-chaperone GroES [Chloroflexota bacterium]|jgi:chaperonin GroES|nr:co-chaperone GroES [Chloroflexota bacterium]HEX2517590.1 co-chaperone GroES [Chloroflexota bacterium]
MAQSTKTALRPLGDKVVVRPTQREETTKSGIVLPDTAKEKPQEGVVVAVGTGRVTDEGDRIKPEVKEGEKVLYAKYAGTEVKLEEEEYLILSEKDILAVLES